VTRILQVIKGLGRGGAEQLLVNALPHLNTQRFDYEFAYLLPEKDALVESIRSAGFTAHCLDARGLRGHMRGIRELVKGHGFAVVHAHLPYAGIAARLAVNGGLTRSIYTEHNVWACYRPATYWGNALTLHRCDRVVAVSREVASSISASWVPRWRGVPPIEVLHHGIDPDFDSQPSTDGIREELGIPREAPVVGMVGNFRSEKGHRHLIEAFPRVLQALPQARLVLVGQGPLENEVRQLARRRQLDDRIVFAGYREDAPRICASFDVFVLSSEHEGLPIALLEAMALGKAVVATRVGGTPEVVKDGVQGLLVPPRDPRALARGITALLEDPGLRIRMGQEGRTRARRFDIRAAVRRTEELYEEVLG
jgi:glycosyltransferase involved in cell wall biosynthesis